MSRLIQAGALRQYRHNNSDEFVFGYEMEITNKVITELEAENKQLRKEVVEQCAIIMTLRAKTEWLEND